MKLQSRRNICKPHTWQKTSIYNKVPSNATVKRPNNLIEKTGKWHGIYTGLHKHRESDSTPSAAGEMHIQITMRYDCMPVKMSNIAVLKVTTPNANEDTEELNAHALLTGI